MNKMLEQLGQIGLVPVVKINRAEDAVPLARALVAGGLPCAEVTFRTPAAREAIRQMAEAFPEMIVGAGTVLTPAQVDEAVEAGSKFVVSPGFNPEVVDYCLARGVLVMPGVNSPSGVEQCLSRGLEVIKFFPAENSGGLPFIKALAGPYAGVKFMPTGGINPDNLASYTTCPHILACGGTWMVKEDLIDAGRFDEVERLSREAVARMLDFRLAHVGINCEHEDEALSTARLLCDIFHLECHDEDSVFAGSAFELLKTPYLGRNGHIAISTADIDRAVASLSRRGVAFNEDSAKYLPDGRLNAIYLADEFSGFAIHLLRR